MDPVRELGQIVKKALEDSDLDIRSFAAEVGVKHPHISNIVNGRGAMGPDLARRIAKRFGADERRMIQLLQQIHGLALEDPETAPAKPSQRSPTRAEGFLPLVGRAACGSWMEAVANDQLPHGEDRMVFVGKRTAAKKDAYLVEASGDSMTGPTPSGKVIEDGDILVVDPHASKINGRSVVLVRVGDEATVKIWNEAGNRLLLVPTNPKYEPLTVTAKDFAAKGGIAHRIVRIQKLEEV